MKLRLAFLSVIAATSLVLSGCIPGQQGPDGQSEGTPEEALVQSAEAGTATLPVPLTAEGAPKSLKIGVVVSFTSETGEGIDWAPLAEGARVAAKRFADGGINVELVTVDDRGTTEGAVAAIDQLAGQKVSGIVVSSRGAHLNDALKKAGEKKIPVLMPYEPDPARVEAAPTSVWLTGPTNDQTSAVFAADLGQSGAGKVLLIDAGGGAPAGVEPVATVAIPPGADPRTFGQPIAAAANDNGATSVLISGSAPNLAIGLMAFQTSGVRLPLYLTPEALSPRFVTAIGEVGATTSSPMTTVGLPLSDPTALETGIDGQAMSAFLAALRESALDPQTSDISGDNEFSQVAHITAHPGSHDAVVAIVRASAKAQSADPDKVLGALRALKLGPEDGIVTSRLFFSTAIAAPNESVVSLTATTQDVGLRPSPEAPTPTLLWFRSDPSAQSQ
ncbi:MAG: hypothetical protein Q4C87_12220 [Actinomycetaceae bacterium]|nr:hypothetical protein [Actinomycetaceae bacterium]